MIGSVTRSYDWNRVASELGYRMPADYVELIDTYGGGVFCDYIRILEPQAGKAGHDLVGQTRLRRGDLDLFWSRGIAKPTEDEPPSFRSYQG